MDLTSYLLGKNSSSGGGGSTPQSLNDIQTLLQDYITNKSNSYNNLTTENVTLYTPNSNYKSYFIYKYNNKYRVVWFPTGAGIIIENRSGYACLNIQTKITSLNVNDIEFTYGYTSGTCYRTNELNSLEECIEAIQSNSTSYTSRDISMPIAMTPDDPYLIDYANCIIIDKNNNVSSEVMSQRISSNETIEVIS